MTRPSPQWIKERVSQDLLWGGLSVFTDRARKLLAHGQRQATYDHCHVIMPEHLLLALASLEPGVASVALEALGMKLSEHHQAIGGLTPARKVDGPEIEPAPDADAKAIVVYAKAQARALGHKYVGTEHLVLGMLQCENCPAPQYLRRHGISIDAFREEVLKLLSLNQS